MVSKLEICKWSRYTYIYIYIYTRAYKYCITLRILYHTRHQEQRPPKARDVWSLTLPVKTQLISDDKCMGTGVAPSKAWWTFPPTVDGSEIRRSPVHMWVIPLWGLYIPGSAGFLPSTVYKYTTAYFCWSMKRTSKWIKIIHKPSMMQISPNQHEAYLSCHSVEALLLRHLLAPGRHLQWTTSLEVDVAAVLWAKPCQMMDGGETLPVSSCIFGKHIMKSTVMIFLGYCILTLTDSLGIGLCVILWLIATRTPISEYRRHSFVKHQKWEKNHLNHLAWYFLIKAGETPPC